MYAPITPLPVLLVLLLALVPQAHGGDQPPCQTNSDCSDGLFCNGAERCRNGICFDRADRCPFSCDEAARECVPFAVSTFYISDQPLGTAVPGLTDAQVSLPAGTTGELGLFVKTDEPVAGVSLDLMSTLDAINLTGATVFNPGDRWLGSLVSDGTLAADGSSITNIEGAGFVGLGQTGLDPASGDPTSGFLFAIIGYEAVGALGDVSDLTLTIGRNAISPVDDPLTIALGTPNNTVVNVPGSSANIGEVSIVPEPSSLPLVSLVTTGMLGLVRRRD